MGILTSKLREESNLISIYAGEGAKSRKEVIKSISEIIEHLNEDEMIELSFQVLVKLNDMSDNEFAKAELGTGSRNVGKRKSVLASFDNIRYNIPQSD